MAEALTVHLSPETQDQLAALAESTRRSPAKLAKQAIADYVAREAAIVAAIERGRADVRAGRVKSHEEVVQEGSRIIEAARARKAR